MKKVITALFMVIVWVLSIPGYVLSILSACVLMIYCRIFHEFTKKECLELLQVSVTQIKDGLRLTKEVINDEY
jgi:hypothetical protein